MISAKEKGKSCLSFISLRGAVSPPENNNMYDGATKAVSLINVKP